MRTATITSVLAGMLSLTLQTQALESPIPGYGVVEFSWDVAATPGGPTMNFNGTVQQVVAQLLQVNPNWKEDFNITGAPRKAAKVQRDSPYDHYFCNGRWPACSWDSIDDGVTYLIEMKGSATNGPGPGNCGRVSCSYKSAIWWCNDNSYSESVEWIGIATGADIINSNCRSDSSVNAKVAGQIFAKDNWNVIVRYDDDHC